MGDYARGLKRLEDGAAHAVVTPHLTITLTAAEAAAILQHLRWLARERESLLDNPALED